MIKFEQGDILGFIKCFESFTPVAKINELDGNWELGYGFNFIDGKPVCEGMTMTKDQANRQLFSEWVKKENAVLLAIGHGKALEMNISQTEAITSFCYNGGPNVCPKLMKYCRDGHFDFASREFLNGIYCEDKPVLGLLRRRISEYRMFTLGVYERFQEGDAITPEELSLLLMMNARNEDAMEMIKELPCKIT